MNKADLERALKKVGPSTALKPVRVVDKDYNVYEIVEVGYNPSDTIVFIRVHDVLDDESESGS